MEARKEGHATSRIEGVKVQRATRADLVLKPVVSPHGSLEPPRVTVYGSRKG